MPVQEQTSTVTMKGNAVTLLGNKLEVGQKTPEATLTANDLSEVKLSSLIKDKVAIISVVPSLDTPICDLQTKRFNQEAAELGPDIRILTVSMDLPFAQKRWCAGAGVDKLQTLSDYRYASLGEAFGVLIKGLRLLTRAIFVVDKKGVIQYIQICPEITKEPDYDSVLKAVKKL